MIYIIQTNYMTPFPTTDLFFLCMSLNQVHPRKVEMIISVSRVCLIEFVQAFWFVVKQNDFD